VLLELLREGGVDPGGHEAARLALSRILELAGDAGLGDQQIVDLALLEILPELAVRQRLGLLRLLKDGLEHQHAEHGDDDVPGVEMGLLVHHRFLPHATGVAGRAARQARARPPGAAPLSRPGRGQAGVMSPG
jgi:hypothetical protein